MKKTSQCITKKVCISKGEKVKKIYNVYNNSVRAWKRRGIIIHQPLDESKEVTSARRALAFPTKNNATLHHGDVTRTSKGHPRDRKRRRRSPSSSHFFPVAAAQPESRGARAFIKSHISSLPLYTFTLYTRVVVPL